MPFSTCIEVFPPSTDLELPYTVPRLGWEKKWDLKMAWPNSAKKQTPSAGSSAAALFRVCCVCCKGSYSPFEIMFGHPPPPLPKDSGDFCEYGHTCFQQFLKDLADTTHIKKSNPHHSLTLEVQSMDAPPPCQGCCGPTIGANPHQPLKLTISKRPENRDDGAAPVF